MWVYRDDINSFTLVAFDRLGAAAIMKIEKSYVITQGVGQQRRSDNHSICAGSIRNYRSLLKRSISLSQVISRSMTTTHKISLDQLSQFLIQIFA